MNKLTNEEIQKKEMISTFIQNCNIISIVSLISIVITGLEILLSVLIDALGGFNGDNNYASIVLFSATISVIASVIAIQLIKEEDKYNEIKKGKPAFQLTIIFITIALSALLFIL